MNQNVLMDLYKSKAVSLNRSISITVGNVVWSLSCFRISFCFNLHCHGTVS